ncbi:hypothetical protein Bca52824_087807 [Brassica carinata]|uniref:Uncharacterized protein n=1 Tax=Brassica carinata TaxID=52824 RepID=A0A8X7P8V3_BRACI|nr:hypothetical protein Bca52824_087807 [Brassica carinata]
MGNCIHTMRSKHGNIVRDLDDASTKKIKESPQLEVAEQKTGKRRCVKIILTRKQLEQLLLKCPEGVSFKLPETYGPEIPFCQFKKFPLLEVSFGPSKLLTVHHRVPPATPVDRSDYLRHQTPHRRNSPQTDNEAEGPSALSAKPSVQRDYKELPEGSQPISFTNSTGDSRYFVLIRLTKSFLEATSVNPLPNQKFPVKCVWC